MIMSGTDNHIAGVGVMYEHRVRHALVKGIELSPLRGRIQSDGTGKVTRVISVRPGS